MFIKMLTQFGNNSLNTLIHYYFYARFLLTIDEKNIQTN